MTKFAGRRAAILLLTSGVRLACAQSNAPWDGAYGGILLGGANPNACSTATLSGAMLGPASPTTLSSCPGSGIVGGLQFGENYQTKRLVWGVGADVDFWDAKDTASTLKFTGAAPPAGTYGYAGKFSPKEFAILGGRIGYAGDIFLPYVRAGAVITTGARDSTVNYLPTGAVSPVASFNGGKNFASTGWAAGGGADIGLNGAWSITAEYLHVSLGKGADSTTTCEGTAAACAAFAGISVESTHHEFTANMFRIGINYWFDYWSKP